MVDNNETKDIIKGGDKDFSNTIPSILQSLYHCLFFTPVFGKKWGANSKINTLNLPSILFQGFTIETDIQETIKGISNIDLKLSHQGTGYSKDHGKFKKIYNDGYKLITDVPFQYKYEYVADYFYHLNGKMEKCEARVIEMSSEKVISKQSISINLIK